MAERACLVMMLLNEAENIERCLRSIEGLWSRFVISFDNATTDDTEALVRQWMSGREHLGIFHHFDWPDSFAAARNMGLNLAYEHFPDCAYVLSFDGDDLLAPPSRDVIQYLLEHPPAEFKAINGSVYLDPDEYGIPTLMYPRCHLLANEPGLRWVGAAHNVLECPSEQQLLVQQLVIYHKQAPQKRAMREAQRIERNIPNLAGAAAAHPTEARPLFYSANTLLDAGKYEEAEHAYQAYLALSTWPEERYQAILQLAKLRILAGDIAGAQARIWEALQAPGQYNRAEAYIHLADCALNDGRIGEALHWYTIAGELPPPVCSLFLEGPMYTYLPHWRLALLYDRLGMTEKAYLHMQRAYAWRPAPDFEAAARVLEAQCAERSTAGPGVPVSERVEELSPDLPMATQILPLPEAELERLLAEIPIHAA
jgi:tetratricopeptide (TPR) repeat protein